MPKLCVFVLFALAALAASQSCKPHDVPFNSSLVGKSFGRYDSCYRSSTTMGLQVQKNVLVYYPEWNFRQAGAPSFPYCREYYVYHFRKHDMLPFIEHYKPLESKAIFGNHETDTSKMDRVCKEKQKPVQYSVWGATRPDFIASIRRFVLELPTIRDQFLCDPRLETPERFVVNQEVKQVDAFIHFFIGIGYAHFFCAQ